MSLHHALARYMPLRHSVREIHLHSYQENPMRSDLVFQGAVYVTNRYQLVRLLSIATRALHRPGARIQDTMNDALARFGQANPIAFLHTGKRPTTVAGRRRKPHSSWNPEAILELERIVGEQPISISQSANDSSVSSFDSPPLSPGIAFTAVKPMLPAQHAE
jgi:hypothetical protein